MLIQYRRIALNSGKISQLAANNSTPRHKAQRLPAARVHGEESTVWLIDQAAAAELPYFECSV